jgi:putative hydrolase
VSPEPPDVPFGDDQPGNPFQGMPIFGDLARLFQQQGPIGWDAARQLALSVATDGGQEPNVDPVERMRIEPLARVAELHIGTATGLPASTTGSGISIVPVTRGQWANATLDAWRPLFESLAGALGDDASEASATPDPSDPMGFMAPLMQMIGPMMLGMTAGSMVGHLARRSFGQYDLPIPRPPSDELMVVPANFEEFGREWSIPADDLRLWICLQEVAVHTVLHVPHVRAALDDLLRRYVTGFQPDAGAIEDRLGQLDISDPSSMNGLQSLFGDPQVLLGAMQSPAQREMLPRFETLVAAIAGYVDHVVDVAGQNLLQNHGMLAEAVRRRRVEADPSDRFVERLFGLELTQTAYDRGNAFVAGVLERAGEDGLARLWEAERTLPTPAELDAPGLWLARIEFPGD